MTQDPLHRLIRHLTEEEHQGVLRWLRGRGGSKHALALYKAMRKEPQWDKERNLAYAESMAWNTRHLAVEKKNLYARLLKHLRRRGDSKYAIKGIYESLHDFYLLRDRGMGSLALKSLRKAGELAWKSDHLELQAWISYQECLALRQSEDHEAGALEKAGADYAAVTQTLATNFELLRGFNIYFSEANRYNPDIKDPKLQAFIQRYAQPFTNSPRLEYDRLVFFNRLWNKSADLVPFDILSASDFYSSKVFRSKEFVYHIIFEELTMISKFIKLAQNEKAILLLNYYESWRKQNPLVPELYQRFSNTRFFFYLNNTSKEILQEKIVIWEKELRSESKLLDTSLVQYSNFVTFYLLSGQWLKLLRWANDFEYYEDRSFWLSYGILLKVMFHKLIALKELGEHKKENAHYLKVQKTIRVLGFSTNSPIWVFSSYLRNIQLEDHSIVVKNCKCIMDLVETEKDTQSRLWLFTEIYIWASAKVHGRDTYEEYYRLRDEPD